ncbi:MAG: c-type cytochrome [Sphingomicrobium sp.]
MRIMIPLLAVASLSACNSKAEEGQPPAVAAALTFDGASSTDPKAVLRHGDRLTHVLGCRGCHTPTMEGQWFNDDSPKLGKLYASNLTRIIPTMSDAQLESLLRTGKHPVRGDMWIMPSETFQRLSAPDMTALIAFLRTVPPTGYPTPPPIFTAAGQAAIAKGDFKPVADYAAEFRNKHPVDLGPKLAWGRYIAGATCSECHGADLTGIPDFIPGVSTPDLDIAGTYSNAELAELLTSGKGKTRADLGLMSLVGKEHFGYLTATERAAVIDYVKARAERPQ